MRNHDRQRACPPYGRWLVIAVLTDLAVVGCRTQPQRIRPPAVDSGAAAAAALEEYDANHDGLLQADELVACPALAGSLTQYDADGNGALSTEEIDRGIARWAQGQMGAASLPFQVKRGGRGLEGATVRLVPEKFLGETVLPASGITGPGGRGYLGIPKELLPAGAPRVPLVQPGLYRVEITHPSVPIPEKYNTRTELGLEMAPDRFLPAGVVWTLTK